MTNDLNTTTNANTAKLPDTIILLLKDMASEIANRDGSNVDDVLAQLNNNLSRLTPQEIEYLVAGMNIIYKITIDNKTQLSEENTDRNFISFLLKLFS